VTTTPPATATLRRLERASGALATKSVARMDETLPWFRAMPADQRSWVMLIAQAGIASFVEWLRSPGDAPRLTTEVFRAGPQELARSVNLQQAVELVRVTVEVVEGEVEGFGAPGEQAQLREAVLRYSREIAFAAAQVYAGVAELRGAWDARLEALVVDVLLRGDVDETLLSRASALGWAAMTPVAVVIGAAPKGHPEQVLDAVQRAARHAGVDVLAGVPGDRLVVVLGGVEDAMAGTRPLLPEFGAGPVVVGPTVADLGAAGTSARAALAGIRAVPGWPAAPRPVFASDLLAERALSGDEEARRTLVEDVYRPLAEAGSGLLDTVTAYAESGSTLEGAARALFVHPNTVRYRLRRVAEVCGRAPTDPRDLLTLQLALVLGRLADQG
jgi:PucR-like helix-turn-helix protein/diguanylate cyclase with GGDEF domain